MKKLIKWFSIFAVIGTVVGLVIAYFCKSNSDEAAFEDSDDFEEDEDFDLDADLQPTGREYVSLKKEEADAPSDDDEDPKENASASEKDEKAGTEKEK